MPTEQSSNCTHNFENVPTGQSVQEAESALISMPAPQVQCDRFPPSM